MSRIVKCKICNESFDLCENDFKLVDSRFCHTACYESVNKNNVVGWQYDSIVDIEKYVMPTVPLANNNYYLGREKILFYAYKGKIKTGLIYGWVKDSIFYLDLVFTDKEYRNKGVATRLIKRLLKQLKRKDVNYICTNLTLYDNRYMLKNILDRYDFLMLTDTLYIKKL